MTKILIHSGVNPLKKYKISASLEKTLHDIGGNTGNLLFEEAVFRHLSVSDTVTLVADGFGFRDENSVFSAEYLNREFDLFVIPAANWISSYYFTYLPYYTKKLKQLKIPCLLVGLGAQSDMNFDRSFLSGNKKIITDFIKSISDLSASISVRGQFTASILNDLGFDKIRVTGCPSLFRYGSSFPSIEHISKLSDDYRVAVNGTHKEINQLLSLFKFYRKTYFCQEQSLRYMRYSWVTLGDIHRLISNESLCRMISSDSIKIFYNVSDWTKALWDYDFSFGTRFHGNVAALLAGVPALFVSHDSRTKELTDYFDFPSISYTAIDQMKVQDIVEKIDYSTFTNNYLNLVNVFARFYEENNVEHTLYSMPLISSDCQIPSEKEELHPPFFIRQIARTIDYSAGVIYRYLRNAR